MKIKFLVRRKRLGRKATEETVTVWDDSSAMHGDAWAKWCRLHPRISAREWQKPSFWHSADGCVHVWDSADGQERIMIQMQEECYEVIA